MATFDYSRLMPKVWVNFQGTGTVTIRDDENVASITDNGGGDYTVNFSQSLPNNDFATAVFASNDLSSANRYDEYGSNQSGATTGSVRVIVRNNADSATDRTSVGVIVLGGP